MTNPTKTEDRVKEAVRNEWGSRLCNWNFDNGIKRPCDSGAVCSCLDVARAALAAMPEPWRPISEAPIGKNSNDQILVGFMGQFHWLSFVAFPNGASTSSPGYARPTHFMPLPAPPKDPA